MTNNKSTITKSQDWQFGNNIILASDKYFEFTEPDLKSYIYIRKTSKQN